MTTYWEERHALGYYVLVRAWLQLLSPGASLLDVGSHTTPVASWGNFERRYTVDLEHDPKLAGVVSYVGPWKDFTVPEHMTVITCCQVLEHLHDDEMRPFVDKLMKHSKHLIVSVPYEWKRDAEPGHRQDPISFAKFDKMMGKPPLEKLVILDGKRLRIVARWVNA